MKWLFLMVFIFLIYGCNSNPNIYRIQIDVASTKANGEDWDMMGNAPDIQLFVDKHPLSLLNSCQDTYRCNLGFSSVKDRWYIEVYDKDLGSNDLIGKGDCQEGETCDLGQAKILIEE